MQSRSNLIYLFSHPKALHLLFDLSHARSGSAAPFLHPPFPNSRVILNCTPAGRVLRALIGRPWDPASRTERADPERRKPAAAAAKAAV